MSALTDQLCARCFDTPSDERCRTATTLDQLPQGCRARILGFVGELDPHVLRRLFDLGFAPGADAEMLRKAPMRDPLMFRVSGTEIVLRRAEAKRVLVSA